MLGLLYYGYFPDLWWFELVDMLHKLTQVALIDFFPTPATQLGAGMVVAATYLMIILVLRPYTRASDDRLHIFALNTLMLLFLSAYVFRLDRKWDPVVDVLLSIVFILLTALFLGFLLYQIILAAGKKLYPYLPADLRTRIAANPLLKKSLALESTLNLEVDQKAEEEDKRSRRRGTLDGVALTRNALYHPTAASGVHTQLGAVNLMYNPMHPANEDRALEDLELQHNYEQAAEHFETDRAGEADEQFLAELEKEAQDAAGGAPLPAGHVDARRSSEVMLGLPDGFRQLINETPGAEESVAFQDDSEHPARPSSAQPLADDGKSVDRISE